MMFLLVSHCSASDRRCAESRTARMNVDGRGDAGVNVVRMFLF